MFPNGPRGESHCSRDEWVRVGYSGAITVAMKGMPAVFVVNVA